jgi:hypothetical protein
MKVFKRVKIISKYCLILLAMAISAYGQGQMYHRCESRTVRTEDCENLTIITDHEKRCKYRSGANWMCYPATGPISRDTQTGTANLGNVNVGGRFVDTQWVWDPPPSVNTPCSWVKLVGDHPTLPNTRVYAVFEVTWSTPVRTTPIGNTCAEYQLLG